tara:strand:- start:1033 stop:1437 length:405 start_codon:yes stop_codon:yes gene_type:complete
LTKAKLTLLFDGGCPLCLREVKFLRSRDRYENISFIDIDSPHYQSDLYSGISYKDAMGRIHAINESGEILKDVAVFREAYRLVGLGWLYAPTSWPILSSLIDQTYKVWARWRLPLTRRPSLEQLCKEKEFCKRN